MKVFLLGAGASRGSCKTFTVPIAREFGSVLAAVAPCWKTEYPALYAAVQHLHLDIASWPLEPVWTLFDYYAKLQAMIPHPASWENSSRQIKKAILAVYGQRCDDQASSVADDSTLAQLIRTELKSGDVLVSFNYDTIAERLAQRFAHRLITVPQTGGGIKFAKPHGSTSWTLDLNSRSVTYCLEEGRPILASLLSSDVDCGREPLVLGAVPIKSEIIKEVQCYFDTKCVFDVVGAQWRGVVEAVRDADVIVVVGYGFPVEDQYGRFLVREGLRLRSGSPRIEFFELEGVAPGRAEEIFRVFQGRVREVVYRGPVQPGAA